VAQDTEMAGEKSLPHNPSCISLSVGMSSAGLSKH
jgi:hypothetical protein